VISANQTIENALDSGDNSFDMSKVQDNCKSYGLCLNGGRCEVDVETGKLGCVCEDEMYRVVFLKCHNFSQNTTNNTGCMVKRVIRGYFGVIFGRFR